MQHQVTAQNPQTLEDAILLAERLDALYKSTRSGGSGGKGAGGGRGGKQWGRGQGRWKGRGQKPQQPQQAKLKGTVAEIIPKEMKTDEAGASAPPIPRVELHIVTGGQKPGGKKRPKGKGNQEGRGGPTGKCWTCGEPGHIAMNCPKKASTSSGNA